MEVSVEHDFNKVSSYQAKKKCESKLAMTNFRSLKVKCKVTKIFTLQEFVKGLSRIGHNVSIASTTDGFAALTAIGKFNGNVEGSSDRRRSGHVVLVR